MVSKNTLVRDGLFVIRVPSQPPSVHYRPYCERVSGESVLDWAIRRLRANAPHRMQVVCVSDTDSERDRLRAACQLAEPVTFMSIVAEDEAHLCRTIMDLYGVELLIVTGLSHAIAPEALFRTLLAFHTISGAAITDTTGSTFVDPLFIIESSMIDDLLTAPFTHMPSAIMAGVELLLGIRTHSVVQRRAFVWLRVSLSQHLGIASKRWPERIGFQSARDIEVLRNADAGASSHDARGGLIDEWKRCSIAVREGRLASKPRAKTDTDSGRKPRVRILYASNGSGFTGAQQSLCHLIGALDRNRYELWALVSNTGTFSDELRRRDVTVVCPEEAIGGGDLETLVMAQRILTVCAPDLIHANHNIGMPLTAAALLNGTPLVQHVRVQTPRDIHQQICGAAAVIAVSHYVREKIAELDVDLRKVEVIWNGVDTEKFAPDADSATRARQQLGIPLHETVIAMIARMARNKKHDTVIRAVGLLRRTLGRGHLVLVGSFDGDREHLHAVRSEIEREGLAPHSSTIEFMPDIRPVLYASDVLTIPSQDEPLSRAALEAMALGIPVIVSDSGGTKEIIDHGRTGLIVPCGDVSRLTEALYYLGTQPVLAASIGRAALEHIRRTLTAGHCAQRTADVYERVLRGDYARLAVRHSSSRTLPRALRPV